MQYRTYFNGGDCNVQNCERPPRTKIYKNTAGENKQRLITNHKKQSASKERTSSLNTLSRSKSLDIYRIPNTRPDHTTHSHRQQDRWVTIDRTLSNATNYPSNRHIQDVYGQHLDWSNNTPFVKERRRGRSENRTRWGIDGKGKGTLLMGIKHHIQKHSQINHGDNFVQLPPAVPSYSTNQVKTTKRRQPSSDRKTSPTPSQASTNTVIRVRKTPHNMLEQKRGLY